MGERENLRITDVNVFDSVAGRVGGPFDVTIGDGTITSVRPRRAGGGVASNYDPLDVAQYTEREIRAAVDVAENWGTYVTVHAYTPRAVRTGLAAGVRCIEHGQLLDEETIALMAEKRVVCVRRPPGPLDTAFCAGDEESAHEPGIASSVFT